MIKHLLWLLCCASGLVAAPEKMVGDWLLVNGITVLSIDAGGQLTLRNTGEQVPITVGEAGRFTCTLEGQLREARVRGDTLTLKGADPKVPRWRAEQVFHRADKKTVAEVLEFALRQQNKALGTSRDIERKAAEAQMANDARQIAGACMQHLLETSSESVEFSVDPKTGVLSGPISAYIQRVTPGTTVVIGVFRPRGTFTLQNPAAFGGEPTSFDENGRRVL